VAQPDVECVLCGRFAVGSFGVAGDAAFDLQQPGVGAGCLRWQVRCGGEAGQQVAGQLPGVMQYVPLRAEIFESESESESGTAVFSMDRPSSALASFDNSDITKVGASLDRKPGDLLTVLDVEASATPALAVVSPVPVDRPSHIQRMDFDGQRRPHRRERKCRLPGPFC
jgi:hypothetical protein